MNRVGQKIKMTSLDELLCVPAIEGTKDIEIALISQFKGHPFKVRDDRKMDELVESIKLNGILSPVIVRPLEDGYEMISGHRRMHAAKRAGLVKIPAIVKSLNDDEATIIMVDANVQREEILPSERAYAFKMKMDAIKHQGKHIEITSPHDGGKWETSDIVGAASNVSGTTVERYIQMTKLIPELMDLVDKRKIPITGGADLALVDPRVQKFVFEYIKENGLLKHEQYVALRDYRGSSDIPQTKLIEVLNEALPNRVPKKKVILEESLLYKYFPAYYTESEMKLIVINLLEQLKKAEEDAIKERQGDV